VAATVAYGHMGCLSSCLGWPLSRTIRYFALVWPLQQEYLPDTVQEIRYHDGKTFLPPSPALATDAYRKGRLRVRYRRGLELLVNYSEKENWTVDVAGTKYVLPPFGFVAHRPGTLLTYVALTDGQRVDYVESPELAYSTSMASVIDRPILRADGAALLRRNEAGGWWLIPCSGLTGYRWQVDKEKPFLRDVASVTIDRKQFCREIRLDLKRLFPQASPEDVVVVRCAADGSPADAYPVERSGSMLILRPAADAPRYLVRPR